MFDCQIAQLNTRINTFIASVIYFSHKFYFVASSPNDFSFEHVTIRKGTLRSISVDWLACGSINYGKLVRQIEVSLISTTSELLERIKKSRLPGSPELAKIREKKRNR